MGLNMLRFPDRWFFGRTMPEPNSGCLLWLGSYMPHGGYGQVSVGRRMFKAHRVAWRLARGPIPRGLCVLHKCDTAPCVNVDHLFLGTLLDNNADRHRKGRSGSAAGERHARAKLTETKVREIRSLRGRFSQHELAWLYGVDQTVIAKVLVGKSWRHVN